MYVVLFILLVFMCQKIATVYDDDYQLSVEEIGRKYKFVVAVELHRTHICSGTIVHPALILTAGSCLIQSNVPTDYRIRAGTSLSEQNGSFVKVAGLIYNPNFVWMGFLRTKIYDAGIIVLIQPLKFTDKIGKIELPKENEDIYQNKRAKVVGWNGHRLSVQKVIVLSNVDCYVRNKRFGSNLQRYPVDSQICVDSFGKCDKDVGIPLISDDRIYGIYSDHYQSCESGSPPMFTRVTTIQFWINKIIQRYDVN